MSSNTAELLSQMISRLDKLDCLIMKQNLMGDKLSEISTILDQENIAKLNMSKDLQAVSEVMKQRFDKVNSELERISETAIGVKDIRNDVHINLTPHSDVIQTPDWRKIKEDIEQTSMSMTFLDGKLDTLDEKMETVFKKMETVFKKMVTVFKKIDSVETSVRVGHTALREDVTALKQRHDQLRAEVKFLATKITVIPPGDINFLLIGPTGHGKSATGNSILRRKAFATSCRYLGTTEIQTEFCKFEGRIVKVVDTPPLRPVDKEKETAIKMFKKNIRNAIAASTHGLNALLLVFTFGSRFFKDEEEDLMLLRHLFGYNFIRKHCILVFTSGDNVEMFNEDEGFSFQKWCEDGSFKEILKDCNSRAILFDNSTRDETKRHNQLTRLIQMVDNLSL